VHQRSGVDKSCAPAPRRWGVSLAGFAAVVEAAGGRAALEGAGDEWLKERGLLAAVAAAGGLTALIGKPEKWATEHGLDPVIAAAGGRDALVDTCLGKSTQWLKQHVVLPATASDAIPYIELLRARPNGAALVGPATQFLSHAYTMPFLFSVDAAAAWAARNARADGSPHFFYFDLLVVNQHGQDKGVKPEVLWEEFSGGVRSIGHTLLVLAYGNPVPLGRSWCLAEIVTGVGDGAPFEVVMPPAEEAKLSGALVGNFDSIVRLLCTVDLAKAHAWHGDECLQGGVCRNVASGEIPACNDDYGFVNSQVKRGMGFEEANKRVVGRMREWLAREGEAALERLPPGAPRATAPIVAPFAQLLMDLGSLPRARALLLEALPARAAAAAATGSAGASPPHLELELELSECMWRESPAAAGEALALRQRVYDRLCASPLAGPEAPLTLRAGHALGVLKGDTAKALYTAPELLRDVREGTDRLRSVLGDAQALLRGVLAARARVLGAQHPDTLATRAALDKLAFSASGKRDVEEFVGGFLGVKMATALVGAVGGAEERLARAGVLASSRAALAALEAAHGPEHPEALKAAAALAQLHIGRGQTKPALELLERVLKGRARVLGEEHPDTLAAYHELGCLLSGQGVDGLLQGAQGGSLLHRGSRAEALLLRAWEGRKRHDRARAAESGAALANVLLNDPTFAHDSAMRGVRLLWEAGELGGDDAVGYFVMSSINCCGACLMGPCLRCCCAKKRHKVVVGSDGERALATNGATGAPKE
jgi:hypothetical protein